MTNMIHLFDRPFVLSHTAVRPGETKIGQSAVLLDNSSDLQEAIRKSGVRFVLFFAPEDIGIRANGGRPGAAVTWSAALRGICNLQDNRYLKGEELLILGALDFGDLMSDAALLDANTEHGVVALRQLTSEIDKRVRTVATEVFASGAFPILIGGGHNNSYPLLTGWRDAHKNVLSAVNLDPHADYRAREGRHSGNGFSYAREEGALNRYNVVALHEGYNSESMLHEFQKDSDLRYTSFEDIAVRGKVNFDQAVNSALDFVAQEPFGIELDLDSIPGMPVSASTPSGITLEQARRYVHLTASHTHARYFHLCEGSAGSATENQRTELSKTIAYLVSDLIKAQGHEY